MNPSHRKFQDMIWRHPKILDEHAPNKRLESQAPFLLLLIGNKWLVINFKRFQKTIFSIPYTIEMARFQYFLTIINVYFEMLLGGLANVYIIFFNKK